jgi:hypothetical protein
LVSESKFYKNIAIWLEKKGYYVGRAGKLRSKELFIKKGRKKAFVDVVGVRNIGKRFVDEIEIFIIEVKHGKRQRALQLRDIEQARGYQIYGHLCYLAVTENIEITDENETDARHCGVGLLRVPNDFYKKRPEKIKSDDIKEILSAQRVIPIKTEMIDFLNNLGIVKCTLCGCFFLKKKIEENYYPEHWKRDKVFESLLDVKSLGKHKIHRYLCPACVQDLCLLIRFNCVDELERKVRNLEKEMKRLKLSFKSG